MGNKTILAIITARGGSRGIPGKNIKSLAGKPLIAYSIEAAQKSAYISRLVVSTDDSDIAHVTRQFKVEVIDRPGKLAQDDTPTISVLQHTLDFLERSEQYRPDYILLLQPTSPLRTVEHINAMMQKFFDGQYDSMVSVVLNYEPLLECDGNLVRSFEKEKMRRQERKPLVFENGALYLSEANLIRRGKILGDRTGFYEMDVRSSVDIDEPFDFFLAEQIIRYSK